MLFRTTEQHSAHVPLLHNEQIRAVSIEDEQFQIAFCLSWLGLLRKLQFQS